MSYHTRVKRLQDAVGQAGLDAIWVHPAEDFRYLTGLDPIAMERLLGLVVPASGGIKLVVPLLSAEECSEIEDCELFTWEDEEGPARAAAAALRDVTNLGMSAVTPLWAYDAVGSAAPGVKLSTEPSLVANLREIKDASEIELLRESSKNADEIADWIPTLDLYEMTEAQLAGRIISRILSMGMSADIGAIVSSGANAAMPHYSGGSVAIKQHEPLLTDFGGGVGGYMSDITRVHLPRDCDDEVKRAYEVVVEANEAAFDKAAPGVTCEEVDGAARSIIEQAGLGEYFIHRTGHGLGLEEHEMPYIRSGNKTELKPGHVFTIEPGVYVTGRFGLRYENVVVVTERGVESLNESPAYHWLP